MRFTANLKLPTLDIAAYRRVLNPYMEEVLKISGRIWLGAFIELIIPHWSGASRATFEKLAREFGTTIPYGQQQSWSDRKALGRATSQASGLVLEPNSLRWHFVYESTLYHLAYNEYNVAVVGQGGVRWGLIHPTPYHFQKAGMEAFANFARKVTLPNPLPYIRVKNG